MATDCHPFLFGDPAGGRTQNLTLKRRLLCQLSYGAMRVVLYSKEGSCQLNFGCFTHEE